MVQNKFRRQFRILPLGDGVNYSINARIVGGHVIAKEFLPHVMQHRLLAATPEKQVMWDRELWAPAPSHLDEQVTAALFLLSKWLGS